MIDQREAQRRADNEREIMEAKMAGHFKNPNIQQHEAKEDESLDDVVTDKLVD